MIIEIYFHVCDGIRVGKVCVGRGGALQYHNTHHTHPVQCSHMVYAQSDNIQDLPVD
jgi:hypothetical protein